MANTYTYNTLEFVQKLIRLRHVSFSETQCGKHKSYLLSKLVLQRHDQELGVAIVHQIRKVLCLSMRW